MTTKNIPLPEIKKQVIAVKKEVESFESQMLNLMKTQNTYLELLKQNMKIEKKGIKLSKLKKKELREQVDLVDEFSTRSKILTTTIKMNNKEFKLGIKTLLDYRKAGGTTFEYLATFMTSTKEEVQILGFHASAVRRVLYGFFPPGMFRIVNKLATGLNTLGGGYRSIKKMITDAGDAAKDSNNIFSNSIKLLGKIGLKGKVKEAFTILGGSKGKRKRAQNEEALQKIKGKRTRLETTLGAYKRKMKKNPALKEDALFQQQVMNTSNKLKNLDKEEAGRQAYKETVEGTGFTGKAGKTGINQVMRFIKSGKSGLGVKAFVAAKKKIFNKKTWRTLWKGMKEGGKKAGKGMRTFFSGQGIFNLKNWLRVGLIILKSPFKLIGKGLSMVKIIFRPLMTFLIYAVVYVAVISIAVVFVLKTIKEAWKFTSKVISPFIGMMVGALSGIWDGLKELFSGIINGDLYKIASGLIDIVINVVQFLLGLALTIVIGLGTLVLTMLVTGAKKLFKFVIGIFTGAVDIKKNLGKILMLGAVIIGLIFGFPVMLGVLLTGLVILVVKKIGEKLKNMVFGVKILEKIGSKVKDFGGWVGEKLGFKATGGVVGNRETTIVGERGPELVKLPAGSRVYSNQKTNQLLSNKAGGNTINITINAKDTSDAEMRRIAEKIGRLVNNNINRNTGMSGIR